MDSDARKYPEEPELVGTLLDGTVTTNNTHKSVPAMSPSAEYDI